MKPPKTIYATFDKTGYHFTARGKQEYFENAEYRLRHPVELGDDDRTELLSIAYLSGAASARQDARAAIAALHELRVIASRYGIGSTSKEAQDADRQFAFVKQILEAEQEINKALRNRLEIEAENNADGERIEVTDEKPKNMAGRYSLP